MWTQFCQLWHGSTVFRVACVLATVGALRIITLNQANSTTSSSTQQQPQQQPAATAQPPIAQQTPAGQPSGAPGHAGHDPVQSAVSTGINTVQGIGQTVFGN